MTKFKFKSEKIHYYDTKNEKKLLYLLIKIKNMIINKYPFSSLLFLLAIFSNSCNSSNPEENKVISKNDSLSVIKKKLEPIKSPIDTFYNNITQLIGGEDSVIRYKNNSWDTSFIFEYSQKIKAKYKLIKDDRLAKICNWNNSNLKRNNQPDSAFVFYPFSGGDFIHLNFMYPNAREYLMVAREKVGIIPNLIEKDGQFIKRYLNDVDNVLRDIYRRSYFITRNMESDTRTNTTLIDGMFPLILWAISRTGHEVISVKYSNIDENGSMIFIDKKELEKKADAVEIIFRDKKSLITKKITYLSCDISNKGFEEKPRFSNYLKAKIPNKCNSFVKSASYLLHYGSFEQIRNLIKDKSDFLVQDDTGIPVKYFINKGWNVELFGLYEKPVDDFSQGVFQKELDSAYKSEKYYKGQIDFSLGYHWGSKKQNQMVLKKIN